MINACDLPGEHPLYHPDEYAGARRFAGAVNTSGAPGIRYRSVRQPGSLCWGLFTPMPMMSIKQAAHYEMVWGGSELVGINQLKAIKPK